MKLTEKTKKYLVIGGGVVLCGVLVIAIGLQFGKEPAVDDVLPESSTAESVVIIDPSEPSETVEEVETEVSPVIQTNADNLDTSQPMDSRPAQTDQSEQSIQPEVTKPEELTQEQLTDATKMPDGTVVDTPPESVEHENVEVPTEPTPAPDTPQAGDTTDGQIYIPGFGWTQNNGGGGSGTSADDMYENGNKIGNMD